MVGIVDSIISSAYRSTYRNFVRKRVVNGDAVLDIGSGTGFLKPLVVGQGASYFGIEPRTDIYKTAIELYGKDNYENSLLVENTTATKFSKVFALTVLDEVLEKRLFLETVATYADQDTKFYFAVRNAGSPLRRSTRVSSNINGTLIEDLPLDAWLTLLEGSGFEVVKIDKFIRPLITGFSRSGFKAVLLRIAFYIFPLEKTYMLLFTFKLSDLHKNPRAEFKVTTTR